MAESQKNVEGEFGEFETRRQTAFFGVCLTFGWASSSAARWKCRDQDGARQRSALGKSGGVWRANRSGFDGTRRIKRSARTHMHACAALRLCLQLGLGLSFVDVVMGCVVQVCQRFVHERSGSISA